MELPLLGDCAASCPRQVGDDQAHGPVPFFFRVVAGR
jgi:hypothetical protein